MQVRTGLLGSRAARSWREPRSDLRRKGELSMLALAAEFALHHASTRERCCVADRACLLLPLVPLLAAGRAGTLWLWLIVSWFSYSLRCLTPSFGCLSLTTCSAQRRHHSSSVYLCYQVLTDLLCAKAPVAD